MIQVKKITSNLNGVFGHEYSAGTKSRLFKMGITVNFRACFSRDRMLSEGEAAEIAPLIGNEDGIFYNAFSQAKHPVTKLWIITFGWMKPETP